MKVLKNAVEKDIQSLFFRLNLMQNIMLFPKYSIRDHFIYPNSMLFKFIGLCAAIFYSAMGALRIYGFHNDETIRLHFEELYMASYFDFLFYGYGYFMIFILNVVQTNTNVKFVLNYQKIHRFFYTGICMSFDYWSRASVLIIAVWVLAVLAASLAIDVPIYLVIFVIFNTLFDFCSIYAIRLITLLKNSVILMNVEIQMLEYTTVDQGHSYKLWKAYRNIMKCYKGYICFYRHPVSVIF